MELSGILLVISALDLRANLSGFVKGPSFWTSDSFTGSSLLDEVLLALDLVTLLVLLIERPSFGTSNSTALSINNLVMFWAFNTFSLNKSVGGWA